MININNRSAFALSVTYNRTAGRLGGVKRRSYCSDKITKPPAGNQQSTNGLQPTSHPDISRQRANRLNAVQPRMHMQKKKGKNRETHRREYDRCEKSALRETALLAGHFRTGRPAARPTREFAS